MILVLKGTKYGVEAGPITKMADGPIAEAEKPQQALGDKKEGANIERSGEEGRMETTTK